LGRQLAIRTPAAIYADAPTTFEIVGIVRDVRSRGLDVDAPPAYYLAAPQFPQASLTVFVKTAGEPLAFAATLRGVVRALDPQLPIVNLQPLDAHAAAALARPRFLLAALGGFGAAVFLLAALGVYGLISYAVSQRRFELAVRSALGAQPHRLIGLVFGEGAWVTVAGLAAGLVAAAIATRALQALLYGIDPLDPLTFGVVTAAVVCASAAASLLPALRAGRIDAASALRD
jgi:predicted lysophospholipase L1 biosynthesis ABC-type transport system permease subunit